MDAITLSSHFFFQQWDFKSYKEMGKGQNQNGKRRQEEEKGKGKKEEQKKITEVVVKVYMHCEGCKHKLSKCLKASRHGVEEVAADMENKKVVIKGNDLNPERIMEEIKKKYSKNVELISPKELPDTSKQNKPEPKKEEVQMKTVELKMNMHCEGCENDIKQTIGKMEGVMRVETDRESSKVIVKGMIDPPKLMECIKKRMGKKVEIFNKKSEDKSSNNKDSNVQHKLDHFTFKYPPQYSLLHIYPNQTFSDDNVFSCSIM
ncbi:heavy metal-associated isoprenylated plant protein 8 [Cucumis sativus]|uniref:HMA domain-containing protein n=1 Tax=Cucumis sativus TaxID=3659 RepID=A0A0A0KFC0_CUCSA|nr:heavy metal-associated isoprenylated plant protein 8 [Cucumis sativus]